MKDGFTSESADAFVISSNIYKPFIFLSLKIWIFVTANCLEIEDVFKFDSLEACKGKKAALDWLALSTDF